MDRMTMPTFDVTLATGETLRLEAQNPDLIRWDLTRAQEHWPTTSDAPMLWSTFVTWAAAKRTGATELPWAEWRDTVAMVVPVDDEELETVDPSRPAASLA